MIKNISSAKDNKPLVRLCANVRSRPVLLLAFALLLGACTTVDDRIADHRTYCSKVGYAAESEGMRDCVVQLEAARHSRHVHHSSRR
jgi:hypothetical protein